MSPLRLLVLALVLSSPMASAQSPASSRISALRAEIAAGKEQLVARYAELREREENGDSAGADLVRLEIEAGKKVLLPKYVELAELEQAAAATPATPAPTPSPTPAPPPAPRPAPAPAPTPPAAPAPAVPPSTAAPASAPPPAVASRRSGVDPKPYESSAQGRVAMIRVSVQPRWLVLDDRRAVIWLATNEAYLLGLEQPCPTLFTDPKPRLQTFSTKLTIEKGAVLAGGQACRVTSITLLGGRNLPKPPR